MPSNAPEIAFKPIAESDLAMLAVWLAEPHVRQWWGEPDEELALMRSILEEDDGTEGFVVSIDGQSLAYIQSWRPANFNTGRWLEDAPWIADVPAGSVGVDIFIGRPDMVGRGVGAAIVTAFCRRLFADGAPRLIIDPDAANVRAVRAYEKAGFRPYGRHADEDGATLLMELLPEWESEAHDKDRQTAHR